jgi:Tol biopolymer transport system component
VKHNPIFLIIPVLLWVSAGNAQDPEKEIFNHTELEWQTIETPHFLVHFHSGEQRTAQEVAKIAESVYDPITEMYGHKPDQKVSYVIRDYDDYSNGGAYFYDNKVEVWASALDFEWRGTHPWLQNVVTHEFTHIVQIQTSMKFGRKMPGIYFQWLGYEAERRPDVLYGYPNVIVSYPISGFIVPGWFAEGVAQYGDPNLRYDYWDSHRDMILRMYMIDGKPLSWQEMAVFGKTSFGNESVYNAGFSLVGYIASHYGIDRLQKISRSLSSPLRLTIDGAIEATLQKSGSQLYAEWKAEETAKYRRLADSLGPTRREGTVFESEGFGNYYPAFTPDGSKIAYVSNKGEDYLSASSIYLYDRSTHRAKILLPKVRSTLSFSPDGRYLYFVRITRDNPHWSAYSDLYRYDMAAEKEKRLTHGLRALNPRISADGKRIVFAFGNDGTLNLGVCNDKGGNVKTLTRFRNGEQVYTPVWSPDGKRIAFGYSTGHNQSLALIDSDGAHLQILKKEGDCRNPFFASDSLLYYSWDEGGIFNIYSTDLASGTERKITNVLGSAFLPSLDTAGNLAYVTYTSDGYKLALLQRDSIVVAEPQQPLALLAYNTLTPEANVGSKTRTFSSQSWQPEPQVAPMKDTTPDSARSYRSVFGSLSLIPFVRIDNYNESSSGLDVVKPGLYISSDEVLNKMSLFGGAAINRKYEMDLFLILDYRDRLPLLYQLGLEPTATFELYDISRTRNASFDLLLDAGPTTINTDVSYNLFEFDFSLKQNIFSENNVLKLGYSLSRYNQDVGAWWHPQWRQTIPASRSVYLIGNILSAELKHDGILPSVDKAINPVGRSVRLKLSYELNQFNPTDTATYENGFRKPIYTNYDFPRLELDWDEHLAMPIRKHTLTLSFRGGSILGNPVDEFFDFYGGGMIGMRGYPFYAIGGNRLAMLNLTYRFPIAASLDFRLLQFYFKKLYASAFYDIGNAWRDQTPPLRQWKRDAGFELRLEAFSFYAYPTSIFFSGAYGLDRFSRNINNGIDIQTVTYGHEWRFYLGVLFDFELTDLIPKQLAR